MSCSDSTDRRFCISRGVCRSFALHDNTDNDSQKNDWWAHLRTVLFTSRKTTIARNMHAVRATVLRNDYVTDMVRRPDVALKAHTFFDLVTETYYINGYLRNYIWLTC